jgi:ribosomal protein L37AE/L43A
LKGRLRDILRRKQPNHCSTCGRTLAEIEILSGIRKCPKCRASRNDRNRRDSK